MTLRAHIDREAQAVREWLATEPPIVVVCAVIGVCLVLAGIVGLEIELGGMK